MYVIVGGGTAGIGVATQLTRELKSAGLGEITPANTAIIDPADKHYYQPGWSLVGSGEMKKEHTAKNEKDVLPDNVGWIKEAVSAFEPQSNQLKVGNDRTIVYEYLVVATGYKLYWDQVKGLKDTITKNGVSSIYSYDTVDSVWENIKNFKGGKAIFTCPSTPVKCGGAPQKIMWMAEDHWIKNNVRDKADIEYINGTGAMFSAPKYSAILDQRREEHGIGKQFKTDLIEVNGQTKTATFKSLDNGQTFEKKFDFLHVVPFQGPPEVIKNSPLATTNGMVDFSLGDSSSLPTSKTAAAVMSQAPTLVGNLIKFQKGEKIDDLYNGYTSCPLLLGKNNLMLAEFDYSLQPDETFSGILGDQGKPNAFYYFIKKYVFPFVYWNLHTKGQWYGRNTVFKPSPKPVAQSA